MAKRVAPVITRPAVAAPGRWNSRVTTWLPAGTGMPTKAPSASTTGTGRPSMRASHPGKKAVATTTRAGSSPWVSSRHLPSPGRVWRTVVVDAEMGSARS